MLRIESFSEIQSSFRRIKSLGKNFATNFFPDEYRSSLWINNNQFFYEDYCDTICFFRKNSGFENLYFISADLNSLKDVISNYKQDEDRLLVVDIVGRKNEAEIIASIFVNSGFFKYTELYRMLRTGNENNYPVSTSVVHATEFHSRNIYVLLYSYFDPLAEQLPMMEELLNWINNKTVLVWLENESVLGFLIYELLGQTSYLRYWFVHPEHREKKIGSALINAFFSVSRMTTRQIFWVINSNENAINRYIHYGFQKDNLHDFVLTNKNIFYGRQSN